MAKEEINYIPQRLLPKEAQGKDDKNLHTSLSAIFYGILYLVSMTHNTKTHFMLSN